MKYSYLPNIVFGTILALVIGTGCLIISLCHHKGAFRVEVYTQDGTHVFYGSEYTDLGHGAIVLTTDEHEEVRIQGTYTITEIVNHVAR